jgi:alginate O-acetyltransferase complex protein AlgI
MLFNTFQFAIFFGVLLLLYRSLPQKARNPLLLVASILFYSLWIPSYLLLLLADLVVNYALLRAMVRSARPKPYLVASIVFTLGLLGWFKYAALSLETAMPVLQGTFGWTPQVPELFLPLGISFYSFQIIALSVDTYRGTTPPVKSFSRYALFISFFPQLIAGPILRGYEFLPQLEQGGRFSSERTRRGLWLIASGLVKKVIFADFLLSTFVNDVFYIPEVATAPFHLVAVYSFAFQIYFDFSGYTDMARGLACLLGFELPLNFMEPYLARNPSEFWRRWHMTLSRWLQDYLYIPLGGNRHSRSRTYVNLLITMLLGGLWHGAAWTFVVWGGLHGVMLMLHRAFGRRSGDVSAPLSWRDAPRILLLFHCTCLLWVFFRAGSFADAATIIQSLFSSSYWVGWPIMQTGIVVTCMVMHVLERWARARLGAFQRDLGEKAWGSAFEGLLFGIIVGAAIAVSGAGGEFIYFQF